MSFSLLVLGVFELAFAFWAVMSLYRAVDNIRLLFSFDHQDEPSLKYLLVAYSFWFVGLALLCVGMGAAFWSYRAQIFENPWLIGISVLALTTAPISEHLFQKSTGDYGDDSNFLALIAYLRYTLEQGRLKARAKAAQDKVLPKYLENAGWSAAIPNLKGLPHAVIKERVCMFKYDDEETRSRYSEFEIHWVNRLEDGATLLKKAA